VWQGAVIDTQLRMMSYGGEEASVTVQQVYGSDVRRADTEVVKEGRLVGHLDKKWFWATLGEVTGQGSRNQVE
jgi:hypothetical protein